MTKENVQRLYDHYCKVGYDSARDDILSKHPWLKAKKVVKEEPKKPKAVEKESPKNGKKSKR